MQIQLRYLETSQNLIQNFYGFNLDAIYRMQIEYTYVLNIILPLDCVNITCMNHITDFSQFPPRDETLAIPFKL